MRRFWAGVTVAALAGCASMGKQAFQAPHVSLRDVKVVGVGTQGGELEVALNVHNPNNYRLDTSKLSYNVFISDTVPLANGVLDQHVAVQAGDSTIVKIPVSFKYAAIGIAARQLTQMGVISYRVTGEVGVATVVGNYTVPFSSSGRFSSMRR